MKTRLSLFLYILLCSLGLSTLLAQVPKEPVATGSSKSTPTIPPVTITTEQKLAARSIETMVWKLRFDIVETLPKQEKVLLDQYNSLLTNYQKQCKDAGLVFNDTKLDCEPRVEPKVESKTDPKVELKGTK